MKDPRTGVPLSKRYYRFKVYADCFVGLEAVDWLLRELPGINREEAVAIGEMLLSRGIIQHVVRRLVIPYNKKDVHPFLYLLQQ